MNISGIYAQLRRLRAIAIIVKEGELTVIAELLSYLNKVTHLTIQQLHSGAVFHGPKFMGS